MNNEVKIKKLRESAIIPTQGSEYAAGYDLYATEDLTISPGCIGKIYTGLAIAPPAGYFGAICARSGLSTKKGLRPANCVGICDEDYTGEYIVALYNDSDSIQHIEAGERIAQLVFLPHLPISFVEVDELEETIRGAGGFGSTGAK